MDDLFKDKEFTQFVMKKYFVDSDMTDKEKLNYIRTSIEAFNEAADCFRKSGSVISNN